ncbi:MAG: DUF1588 domain-containing protein, partial [Myxococcota bacterium]
GILMQPAFLSVYAHEDSSSPIARGHFVRERLLCQDIPPLPEGALNEFPPVDPELTQREHLEDVHSANSTCYVCHRLMDPIGFSFESYDGVGAYRTEEKGKPIDSSGALEPKDPSGDRTVLSGAADLSVALADSTLAQHCFVDLMWEHLLQRTPSSGDERALESLKMAFEDDDSILTLVADIIAREEFVRRQ